MSQTFQTIWTLVGQAKLAEALATATPLRITQMALGDADYTPTAGLTALVGEVWRGPIASANVNANNANWLEVRSTVTATTGGFTIREVGLFDDDGDLVVISKYPQTYKPVLAGGSTIDLDIVMVTEIQNADNVEIVIDATVAIASVKYVQDEIEKHRLEADPHPNLDIRSTPRGYISGLEISPASSDAERDVTVAPGLAASDDGTAEILLEGGIAKQFDAAFAAGDNAGGFASGESLPTSGTVHIWAISGPSGVDVFANDNATSGLSPTLPAGFTAKRRIASLRTDASANLIPTHQSGDIFLIPRTVDMTRSGGFARALVALTVPHGISVQPIGDASVSPSRDNASLVLSIGDHRGAATIRAAQEEDNDDVSAAYDRASWGPTMFTDIAGRLFVDVAATATGELSRARGASTIAVTGWRDMRRL